MSRLQNYGALVRVNGNYPYMNCYTLAGNVKNFDGIYYLVRFPDGDEGLFSAEELYLA